MKNKDIEKRLRASADSFTPNILNKIMQTPPAERHIPVHSEEKQNRFSIKKTLAFASLILIIVGSFIFFNYMLADNETIYLEVNPSIEVVTNRFNYVKKVSYINEDAEEMFRNYNIKGKKIDDVVVKFVDLCFEKGYLVEGNAEQGLFISADSIKNPKAAEKTLKRLQSQADKRLNQNNVASSVLEQLRPEEKVSEDNKAIARDKAREENIPMAKMVIINQIIELDDSYTLEELKDKSIRELREMLSELKMKNGNSGKSQNRN